MELRDYGRVLRRNIVLLILAVVLGVSAGAAYCALQKPVYQSTARAFVATTTASTAFDLSQGAMFTESVVKSYADLATSSYVLRHVIDDLRLDVPAKELARSVSATASADSVVLEISASDASASRAAAIANAVTDELSQAVSRLTRTTSASSPVSVTPIEAAVPASTPIRPDWAINLALGGIVALALAITFAIFRDVLDTRVRSAAELKSRSGRPLLGVVHVDRGTAAHPIATAQDPFGHRAEAYRALRTNLEFLDFEGASRVLVVTSSVEHEGKSTTAANLAVSLREAGQRVVLVDADLRRPAMADAFGIDGGMGLTDVLIGKAGLDAALQTRPDGLDLLPAGRLAPNPAELLQSRALTDLLSELSTRYDVVLLDAPPVLPVADAVLLARRAAGAVLVAAVGEVRRPQVLAALESLDQVGARVFGVIANKAPAPRRGATYGYGVRAYAPQAAKTGVVQAVTA